MDPKARSEFLKKLSINGFAIEDKGDILILRPRGMESEAVIVIKEIEPNKWTVTAAAGRYAGFYRGKKRMQFETYISRWVQEAVLVAAG